jgi:uncharacterized protein (TIGR02996 family)
MPEEAFLKAVLEQPESDPPRLAYAHWLEEHGYSLRAEFIRVQCDLAKLAASDPRRPALDDRAQHLLVHHGETWAAPFQGLVSGWQFERGFVVEVTATASAFLDHAGTLFRLAPVQRVRLLDVRTRLPKLAACPFLARVAGLDLRWNHLGDAGMQTLAAFANLGRLTALDLSFNGISDAGVRMLAASPWLAQLHTLNLYGNCIGDAGLQALAASPGATALGTLILGHNKIGNAGVRALAKSPHLMRLTRLDLSNNPVGTVAVQALTASRSLAGLKCLNLSGNFLVSTAAEVLAEPSALAGLTALDVSRNLIGPEGQEALRVRFGDHVRL